VRPRAAVAPLLLLAALAAGCGKEAPKTESAEKERADALERSKHGAFGTQVQGLEKAKGLEADLDKKTRESVDKIESGAK
jgi:hypothetical protein